MKVIFAQGNPGRQYTATRHNVGFIILDALADGAHFAPKPKFFAEMAETQIAGEKTLLVKPQTFYNETGRSARAILDFYKLDPSDLLVIHDDLALPFGSLRIREKGSDAGNNGIKSLNAHLGPDYMRLRVGIYNDLRDRMHDADFVLGNLSSTEQAFLIKTIIPKIDELVESFCRGNLEVSSHTLTQ